MTAKYPHGHRVFGVAGAATRDILVAALSQSGLRELHRFTSGPTTQVVFDDGTVINLLDRRGGLALPSTALTIPVVDPRATADSLATQLRAAGHTAEVFEPVPTLPQNSFVIVFSTGLEGWIMGFRSFPLQQIEDELAAKHAHT